MTPPDEAGPRTAPGGMSGGDGPLLRIITDQRVAFLIVGGLNTVIGFAWFTVFLYTVGAVLGYIAALVCAWVASVLCAFVLYRRLVFHVTGNVLVDLLRFTTVYLVSLAINLVLLPLLVELGGLHPLLAQALIVIVTTVVSYVGHRYFSFRRGKETTA